MNKNQKILIIIFSTILVITLILILVFAQKNNNNDNNDDDNNIIEKPNTSYKEKELVTDHDRFYTVQNCITNYYSYIFSNEYEKVYLLLNPEYIKRNNLTKNNLKEVLNLNDKIYTYNSVKIYSQKLKNNITRYYVYGNMLENIMDVKSELEPVYTLVYLDESTLSYSIEPISEIKPDDLNINKNIDTIYNSINKLYENNNYNFVEHNELNKYNVVHLSNKNICDKYYYNMKDLFIYNFEESKKKMSNVPSSNILNSYFNGTIQKFSLTDNDSNLICVIIDSNNLKYTFNITNVLEYSVSLDTYKENE